MCYFCIWDELVKSLGIGEGAKIWVLPWESSNSCRWEPTLSDPNGAFELSVSCDHKKKNSVMIHGEQTKKLNPCAVIIRLIL